MQITRFATNQRMSQAVRCGNFVFTAGQVAKDSGQDLKGQAAQCLAQIDALLAQAGTDKTKILMANIWLSDISGFSEMNDVWDAWVPDGAAPARACVESSLASPQFLVEIGVVAVV